jgi:hypothetical protein
LQCTYLPSNLPSLMLEFRKLCLYGASCTVLAEQWNTLLFTSI